MGCQDSIWRLKAKKKSIGPFHPEESCFLSLVFLFLIPCIEGRATAPYDTFQYDGMWDFLLRCFPLRNRRIFCRSVFGDLIRLHKMTAPFPSSFFFSEKKTAFLYSRRTLKHGKRCMADLGFAVPVLQAL